MNRLSLKKLSLFYKTIILTYAVALLCSLNANAEPIRLFKESFLDIGNHWEYQVQLTLLENDPTNLNLSQVEDITESKNVAGFDTRVRRRQISGPGISVTESVYFFINAMDQLVSAGFEEDDSTETVRDGDPTELLPLVIDTSDNNRPVGHGLYRGEDKEPGGAVWNGFEDTFVTYITEETITVPAGTFDCVVIDFRLVWDDQDGDTGRDETRFWINPDIGIIKAMTNEFDTSQGFTEQTTFTSELSSTNRTVSSGAITANFQSDITSGTAPLTVQFTDSSTAENTTITTWQWDFDNDETIDSTAQNPQWTYQEPGLYSVKLTVSDGTIEDQTTKDGLINVQVSVPNLVGLTETEARQLIEEAGLVTGTVTLEDAPAIPINNVISQDPEAEAEVDKGTAVNLVVSRGTPLLTVPNVTSLTQAEAVAALEAVGLVIATTTNENHETIPAGNVIRQDPEASSQVEQGSPINLVVSLGPPMVTVPDVTGLTQSVAEATIPDANLVVGTITSENNDTTAAGTIIRQNPEAGTQVEEGSMVNLVVSLGPPMVPVPDVLSLTESEAESTITGANLVVGSITSENHDTIPAGSVISQNPEGGEEVVEESAVNLVISLGPANVAIPNVVGQPAAEAEINLMSVSLILGTVASENSATVPPGNVIRQDPEPGNIVDSGSSVNLVVSSSEIIPLNEGWNLVSTENTISDTAFELLSDNDAIATIWQFENGRFKIATEISPLKGYYIHTFASTTLVIPL